MFKILQKILHTFIWSFEKNGKNIDLPQIWECFLGNNDFMKAGLLFLGCFLYVGLFVVAVFKIVFFYA